MTKRGQEPAYPIAEVYDPQHRGMSIRQRTASEQMAAVIKASGEFDAYAEFRLVNDGEEPTYAEVGHYLACKALAYTDALLAAEEESREA